MLTVENRKRVGFETPDGGKIFVRSNGTVRFYGHGGQNWQTVGEFDLNRSGSLVIMSVEVFDRAWLTLERYPEGKAFPSLNSALHHGKAVARSFDYEV